MASSQPSSITKYLQIIVFSLVMAGIFYGLGSVPIALGILGGAPVGLFNYWLVASTVSGNTEDPRRAQNRFMGRALLRLGISIVALLLGALLVGADFMIGVLLALILQMLTYFLELGNIIKRKERNHGRKIR
ncbi:MAG: ATP synthase subunit I [Bacillota bacterium]